MNAKNIFILFLSGVFFFSSCVDDLNVEPLNENTMTAGNAYEDPDNYKKALLKLYAMWALTGQYDVNSTDIYNVSDPGLSQLLRAWWTTQVATTDECKIAWPNTYAIELNNLTWTNAQNDALEAVYLRCMTNVAYANDYMLNIVNHQDTEEATLFAAEARFCRAFVYYILLDQFGIPPFITEKNYSVEPGYLSRKDLFAWIEGELKEIRDDLPDARQGEYGRADKGVVNALLARMYLNAEVYTGTPMYNECIAACINVINGGYKLSNDYSNLFKADNGENPDTRQEIIFPVVYDGLATQTTGGTMSIIIGSRNANEYVLERDGVSEGWGGFRTTQNLVNLFEFQDNNNKTADNISDKRGIFYSTGRSVEITTDPINTFTTEGWAVYKYKNVKSDGSLGSNSRYPDTDFPLFRLADVYLMYAEAVARGGQGGDITTAVGYVNELRERAFGDNTHAIDAAWLSTNNYRNILDERARELYWEGTRRTDLIRYGLFTSATYVWPSKGSIITGKGVDDKYNIFPIPISDLTVNKNLDQNEGY